ncbi:hypothetical protein, partial [Clostridium butyricum]|uniref:hypothetical protein n=1 Tax=Clostridium butyricum TaxID=1492 RepID=UPI0005EAF533
VVQEVIHHQGVAHIVVQGVIHHQGVIHTVVQEVILTANQKVDQEVIQNHIAAHIVNQKVTQNHIVSFN